MHFGNGYILVETGGAEEITLTLQQIPVHSHPLLATTSAAQESQPYGNIPGRTIKSDGFSQETNMVNLSPTSISPVGGSQSHTNFQPYLCIDFIISLFGIFPSQT
ncbi:MAG: hypothetical protein WC837_08580 [Bellilinea sp.]